MRCQRTSSVCHYCSFLKKTPGKMSTNDVHKRKALRDNHRKRYRFDDDCKHHRPPYKKARSRSKSREHNGSKDSHSNQSNGFKMNHQCREALPAYPALEKHTVPNVQKMSDEDKYKTTLCSNYMSGRCRFGVGCNFAHGSRELVGCISGYPAEKIWRSKPCREFAKGSCRFGAKCQFHHGVVSNQRGRESRSMKSNECSNCNKCYVVYWIDSGL